MAEKEEHSKTPVSVDSEKAGAITSVRSVAPSDFIDYSPEEEKKVVRKIDMVVLPLMCFVFFCCYMDKQTLSYTAVFGLKTDLKLDGNQYSWLTSGFYLSQMISQFFYTYMLSRFPIKIVTGVCVVCWAAACMCLAAPKNFAGFLAVRAVLGFCEGCVSPSFVIVTSLYYKKSEHSLRTAIWISCNAITQVVCTFMVYGLGKHTEMKMAVWRVTFLIAGCLTLVAGLLFFFLVPHSPESAWFLTPREREISRKRILAESDRGEKTSWDWSQAKECVFDWVSWSSFLFGFLITVTSGPITFSSLMINDFGYDKFKTLIYSAPSGAVQFFFIWVGIAMLWLVPKQRCYIIMILILIPLAGNIALLCMRHSSGWGVIVGSWLGSCITSFYCILLSLNASNVRGNTKKSIVNNAFYVGYALACIVYPQWWNYSKDPTYKTGLVTDIVFWVIMEALVYFYRFMCVRTNKKRDALEAEGKLGDYDPDDDLTDKQDMYHRYSY
ncbi:DEKNAAC105537 [Brettanomyces naardenensis]|uniref:DEKNAAC105537 n=1 Tax=Brettanomyces naardenensis TaxID=13370 RepID=A0A448YU04_BRENA|nr:DEKNAAC105537 [Brettanomyces naardenensis]